MVHRFGAFTYDSEQRLLFREGEPVPILPKVADTLNVLLERRGRIVDKQELMRLVWPDAVVEDSGLARNISLLRKALGEDADRFIETMPKRGYRFASLESPAPLPPETAPTKRPWRLWPVWAGLTLLLGAVIYWQFFVPGPLLKSTSLPGIAVLPFEADGFQPAAFPPAFHEVLTAQIASTGSLRVVSPSTVDRYRNASVPPQIMSRILGVDVILEGKLQRSADSVRATARLADVHTGRIVWAGTYDRPAADLLAAQTELARAIAEELARTAQKPR